MNEQEMREYLKDKSEEEIREFIIDRLKKICEQGEKLSVEDEDYERAGELLKIMWYLIYEKRFVETKTD